MKKQALSLFLAGALALSLFGCSAQPAAESAPQSSPAETAGSSSAGVVEELHLGTTAANDTFTTFVESGAFGKMCYNSFVTAPFWQTGPNGEVEPFLVTDWTVSEDSTTITCDLALNQGITWHAVSYTHLDVYKRQPMSSTSAIPLPAWPCMTPPSCT